MKNDLPKRFCNIVQMIRKLRGKYECAKIALTRLPAGPMIQLYMVARWRSTKHETTE